MQTESRTSPDRSARLPAALALPLRLVPAVVHSTVLATVLDRVLAGALADGELEFLFGRTVAIRIDDAQVEYRLFLGVGGFYAGSGEREADVCGTILAGVVLSGCEQDRVFERRDLPPRKTPLAWPSTAAR